MISHHFNLQGRLLWRRLGDLGPYPVFSLLVIIMLYVAGIVYLFHRTTYAPIIIVAIGVFVINEARTPRRIQFLRSIYSSGRFHKIRILEDLIVASPFIIPLLIQRHLIHAVVLAVFAAATSSWGFNWKVMRTIPTPFGSRPFEFAVGFRKTFVFILIAYGVAILSIPVGNANLGMVAYLALFVIIATYYLEPEQVHFVWSYSLEARRFIIEKIKTCLLHMSMLNLPALLLIAVFYPGSWMQLMAVFIIGHCFVIMMLLAKYAAYPERIGLSESVLIGLCVYLPPAMLVLIPYFYTRSLQRLKRILG
jgi:hypothetical protein